MRISKNSKFIYYIGIVFVVLIWSLYPVVTKNLFTYYTPSLWSTASSLLAVGALAIISRKKLKQLNKDYFKVAVPTGLFFSVAGLTQNFGLTMTTPAACAFLENLTCVCVPILMLILAKEKLTILKILAALMCLAGVFVLCGGDLGGGFGMGMFLCALAGIFYSVNIAGTGIYAKKLDTGLYLLVQFAVQFVISAIYSLLFVKDPLFSFAPVHLGCLVGIVLISSVLCWIIRTACLKNLDPSFVAVAMPFSSVLTSVISILTGADTLSFGLVAGGILIFAAILISGLSDNQAKSKKGE